MSIAGIGMAATAVVVSVFAVAHTSNRASPEQETRDAAIVAQAQALHAAEGLKAAQAREAATRDFLTQLIAGRPDEEARPLMVDQLLAQAEANVHQVENPEVRTRLVTLLREQRRAAAENALARAGKSDATADKPEPAGTSGLRSRVYQPEPDEAFARLEDIEVELGRDANFETLFEQIQLAGKVLIRLDKLAAIDVLPDAQVPITFGKSSAAAAIRAINEILREGGPHDAIAARLDANDTLIIASESHFDRQERTLATYDITPILERRSAPTDGNGAKDVAQLITQLVHQDHWTENGGDRASISIFDTKLFIQAPARFHPQIKWILQELKADADEGNQSHHRTNEHAPAANAPRERVVAVRWQDGTPVLKNIPLLSQQFSRGGSVTDQVGLGPLLIRATDDGKVRVTGPSGELLASEIHVDLPKGGGGDADRSTKVCTLTVTDAGAVTSFLHALSEVSPTFRGTGQGPRVIANPRTNQVYVQGDAGQLRLLDQLIELIDRPAPKELARAASVSRVYHVRTMPASTLRDILGKVFNTSPVLQQCAVERIMEVDDDRLTLTATADQIELVDRLVSMVDAGGTK